MIKANLHPKKMMLSIWCNYKKRIYFKLLLVSQTINSDKYCQQLNNVKMLIKEKRPILTHHKKVVFTTTMRNHTLQKSAN